MKLVDQWRGVESGLAPDWEDVRLVLTTEQPQDLARAAQVLAPLSAGHHGGGLVFHVRRAGGAQGPEAARHLFSRLDEERVWCILEQGDVVGKPDAVDVPASDGPGAVSTVASWDAETARLPGDWSDALCEIELTSSDHLPRAALLCAPLNPTKVAGRLAFTFRCAGDQGYGASPGMARRCFQRLDAEAITGTVRVLRTVSETDNVATQGTVWLVGGKAL